MTHVIQYDDQTRPIYAKCIEQVKSMLPSYVSHTVITKTDLKARNNDYRALSDIVRLNHLARDLNIIWLDSDILIKKWPDFKMKHRPYINDRSDSVIISNGCNEIFKTMLNQYNYDEQWSYPGWLQAMFKTHRDEFEILPTGYFIHLGLSQAIFAGESFNNYGTVDYNVFKNEKNELDFIVRF